MTNDELVQGLVDVLGAERVLTDPDVIASYVTDWTGRYRGTTPAVVRPRDRDDVATALRWCRDHRVAVVPQGGNTGLVGGSVPLSGEIVLSLRGLDHIDDVDELASLVHVGAGATLGRVREHVRRIGLDVAVDLSARDSATIGGLVATNAGGMHVLRYGPMRAQVAGVEAVLTDGSIVRTMRGLVKDNTGYDLPGLLTGSEGTLAVVTEVALRLIPDHPYRVVALLGCADLETALAVARRLRHDVSALEALEGFFADGATLVSDSFGVVVPFDPLPPVLLLAEAAGARDPTDQLTAALNDLGDAVTDSAVAVDPAGRKTLWALRDRHTEAIAGQGIAHKLDVTLPPGRLALFEREVRALVGSFEPPSRCFLFGHVGDGNLHVNVVGPDPDDRRVDRAVLELAASMGGSISAEHGIGTAKRDLLALNRSPEERALFRSIRHAFDPAGILNPNVLIAD